MQLERSKLTKLRCAFPFIAWIFQAWALSPGFVNKRLSIKIGWLIFNGHCLSLTCNPKGSECLPTFVKKQRLQ